MNYLKEATLPQSPTRRKSPMSIVPKLKEDVTNLKEEPYFAIDVNSKEEVRNLKEEAPLMLSPTRRRILLSITPNLEEKVYIIGDGESKKEVDDLKEEA